MKKPKVSKKGLKTIVTWAIAIIVIVAGLYSAKRFYDWSFSRGYLEGTKNQVLCQASQKDATLASLCK